MNVQDEPKDNDGGGASAASEKSCDNSRSKDGVAKTSSFRVLRLKQVEAGESCDLKPPSHIGGKLAREVKAADMNNLQAALYLEFNLYGVS